MIWLIESAQRILGMRGRDLQDRETRWDRDGAGHGKFYRDYLPDQNKRYSCVHCQAHLAFHNDIISKVSYRFYGFERIVILIGHFIAFFPALTIAGHLPKFDN